MVTKRLTNLRLSDQSVFEKVYESIKKEIYFGSLRPGERLIEEELAKRFDVSRSSVRIVLQRLVGDGFITVVPNKGTTVKKFSIDDIVECYKLQGLLEGFASAEALKYITEGDIESLRKIQAENRWNLASNDMENYLRKNIHFHRILVKKCGLTMLIELIKKQKDLIYRYSFIFLSIPGRIETNLSHHDMIIEAAEKRDYDQMRSIVEMHYWDSGKDLREHFEKIPLFF